MGFKGSELGLELEGWGLVVYGSWFMVYGGKRRIYGMPAYLLTSAQESDCGFGVRDVECMPLRVEGFGFMV